MVPLPVALSPTPEEVARELARLLNEAPGATYRVIPAGDGFVVKRHTHLDERT